jgi:hypothetical protein
LAQQLLSHQSHICRRLRLSHIRNDYGVLKRAAETKWRQLGIPYRDQPLGEPQPGNSAQTRDNINETAGAWRKRLPPNLIAACVIGYDH